MMSPTKEIDIQKAAEMMNVSSQYIVKLLEQGDIPCRREGDQLFINLEEFEQFLQTMEKERRISLDELAKQAQELDMGY